MRKVPEDRHSHRAALGITTHRARRIIAHVESGDEIGRSANEPDVGGAACRACLAEKRTVHVAQANGGAALDHAFKDVDNLVRCQRVHDLLGAGWRARHWLAIIFGHIAAIAGPGIGAEADAAIAILHEINHRRADVHAVAHKDGIGVDHFGNGRLSGTQRNRKDLRIGLAGIADADGRCHFDDLVHPRLRRGPHGHQVAGLLHTPAHCVGAGSAAREIAEALLAKPRRLEHAKGPVDNDRRGGHAGIKRCGINKGLEARSRLAFGLCCPVVGRDARIKAALHRQHLACMGIFNDHPAGNLGYVAQGPEAAFGFHGDDVARLQLAERCLCCAAPRHGRGRRRHHARSSIGKTKADGVWTLGQHNGDAPVRITRAKIGCSQLLRPIVADLDRANGSAPALTAIIADKPVAQGAFCILLEFRIKRGPHPQPAVIDAERVATAVGILSELRDQLAPEFFGIIAANGLIRRRDTRNDAQWMADRLVILLLRDELILEHATQNPVPPLERTVIEALRPVVRRSLGQNGEIGHFVKLQFPHVLAEIGTRGGLHAKAAAAEVDLVEVKLEDLLLGESTLDPLGEDRFLDLADIARLVGQKQVLGDLLRDRRSTHRAARTHHVGEDRSDDAGIVKTAMLEERPVLRSQIGTHQQRREFLVSQLDAALARIAVDRRAVIAAHIGRQRRLIGFQTVYRRQVAGKKEPDDNPAKQDCARRIRRDPKPLELPIVPPQCDCPVHFMAQADLQPGTLRHIIHHAERLEPDRWRGKQFVSGRRRSIAQPVPAGNSEMQFCFKLSPLCQLSREVDFHGAPDAAGDVGLAAIRGQSFQIVRVGHIADFEQDRRHVGGLQDDEARHAVIVRAEGDEAGRLALQQVGEPCRGVHRFALGKVKQDRRHLAALPGEVDAIDDVSPVLALGEQLCFAVRGDFGQGVDCRAVCRAAGQGTVGMNGYEQVGLDGMGDFRALAKDQEAVVFPRQCDAHPA